MSILGSPYFGKLPSDTGEAKGLPLGEVLWSATCMIGLVVVGLCRDLIGSSKAYEGQKDEFGTQW